MAVDFKSIPPVVLDYVREVFGKANHQVAKTLIDHPSFHEPMLDARLLTELAASPPAFFAKEQMAVAIETHFLGGRWMYGRWEIADIAFFVTLSQHGKTVARKVALLQTKRLYSREIPPEILDDADFRIGIGRMIDKVEPSVPLTVQRRFRFDGNCHYDALTSGDAQIDRIDRYMKKSGLPVYYGLYNPLDVPFDGVVPAAPGFSEHIPNVIGCRIIPAKDVHGVVRQVPVNQTPTFAHLKFGTPFDKKDARSQHGWRLERFVADELLRCRQGALFDDAIDANLRRLLYDRTAPITAAINVSVAFGEQRAD